MGLFRLAIVVAVGVSLLPSDAEQQEKLYARAADAAHWTMTFCDRNASTCKQAASFWGEFVKKAEFGAKLAYDALMDKKEPASIETGTVNMTRSAPSHTLRHSDLEPAWRGRVSVDPPGR